MWYSEIIFFIACVCDTCHYISMSKPVSVSSMFCSAGFFIPGFPKLMRFQEHHDRVLKRFLPKIKKRLVPVIVFSLWCILVIFYEPETSSNVLLSFLQPETMCILFWLACGRHSQELSLLPKCSTSHSAVFNVRRRKHDGMLNHWFPVGLL